VGGSFWYLRSMRSRYVKGSTGVSKDLDAGKESRRCARSHAKGRPSGNQRSKQRMSVALSRRQELLLDDTLRYLTRLQQDAYWKAKGKAKKYIGSANVDR
jgi:hypothetical protein